MEFVLLVLVFSFFLTGVYLFILLRLFLFIHSFISRRFR